MITKNCVSFEIAKLLKEKGFTEDYVSFEIAKLLKEKGFGVPTTSVWVDHFKLVGCPAAISIYPTKENWNATTDSLKDIYASAPTLQTAMKWLNEIHNLYIFARPYATEDGVLYLYEIKRLHEFMVDPVATETGFEKSEQACEAAIKYCLENLIEQAKLIDKDALLAELERYKNS